MCHFFPSPLLSFSLTGSNCLRTSNRRQPSSTAETRRQPCAFQKKKAQWGFVFTARFQPSLQPSAATARNGHVGEKLTVWCRLCVCRRSSSSCATASCWTSGCCRPISPTSWRAPWFTTPATARKSGASSATCSCTSGTYDSSSLQLSWDVIGALSSDPLPLSSVWSSSGSTLYCSWWSAFLWRWSTASYV